MNFYDIVIVGAGPAGITAAVYAARQKLKVLILTGNVGGQAAFSGDIENYTGFRFISGIELAQVFEEHVGKYTNETVAIKREEEVTEIITANGGFTVRTELQEYDTKTVIIASGKRAKELGVPGEAEYKNKGVTYCATCDGPIFAGKDVVVVGGGNSALDSVLQLEKYAKKIYLVNNLEFLGGEFIMRDKVQKNEHVEVLNTAVVKEIIGETFVSAVVVEQAGVERRLEVQGVFVEIGLIPNSNLSNGISKNEYSEIVVNSSNETNLPGLFAAGDVTDVPEKQIVVAAGEGAKACLSAIKYLQRLVD